MSKLKPNQLIQKLRTEDEMRQAVTAIRQGRTHVTTPTQDDDTDIVVQDMLEELLQKRATVERFRNFVYSENAEFAKR